MFNLYTYTSGQDSTLNIPLLFTSHLETRREHIFSSVMHRSRENTQITTSISLGMDQLRVLLCRMLLPRQFLRKAISQKYQNLKCKYCAASSHKIEKVECLRSLVVLRSYRKRNIRLEYSHYRNRIFQKYKSKRVNIRSCEVNMSNSQTPQSYGSYRKRSIRVKYGQLIAY